MPAPDEQPRSSIAFLEAAADALDGLASLDLDGLVGEQLTGAVLRTAGAPRRLRCRRSPGHGAMGHPRGVAPSGAKTAAAWLAWKQRIPIGVARQRVRHARAMRDLPPVEKAWANGEIDRSHVTTMLGKRTARTEKAFERDHEFLLDAARSVGFTSFKAHCDRWELLVDPDGAEHGADDDHAARELHLSKSFGGMWFGKITLDPISGEIVHTTLQIIERELFEADWAAAQERLGREPMVLDLDRTPAQRRADALVEMAARARTAPADGRRPAPLFSVLAGYETFAGPLLELFNRTVLTPGIAARWLSDADIERIVFDGPSRVIDVGVQRRFFTGALKHAIELRDRTCFHPSCDEAPLRPEIDHIHEASKGGPTTQDNGRLGCGFHNRWRNHHPDEEWDTTPPTSATPMRAPTHPPRSDGPKRDARTATLRCLGLDAARVRAGPGRRAEIAVTRISPACLPDRFDTDARLDGRRQVASVELGSRTARDRAELLAGVSAPRRLPSGSACMGGVERGWVCSSALAMEGSNAQSRGRRCRSLCTPMTPSTWSSSRVSWIGSLRTCVKTSMRPSLEVEATIRRAALERYNAKYSWNFEIDGDGLNFLVRPRVAYGWHSTVTAVEGGTKWVFPTVPRGSEV